MGLTFSRGDVVWGPDPFKTGERPRPWLILNTEDHPFGDEESITVTLTTTPHSGTIPIRTGDWTDGGMPRQSYVSPWSVASPKHSAVIRRQGRIRESLVRTVIDELYQYLEPVDTGNNR